MFDKKKLEEMKTRLVEVVKERPLESIIVATAAVAAVAKLIDSVSSAHNSTTWRREVKRRERKQRYHY